LVKNSASSSNW